MTQTPTTPSKPRVKKIIVNFNLDDIFKDVDMTNNVEIVERKFKLSRSTMLLDTGRPRGLGCSGE